MLKFLRTIFVIIFILILLVAGYVYHDYQKFLETPVSLKTTSQIFEVKPGDGIKKIAARFQQEGIVWGKGLAFHQITAPYYFEIYARLSKKEMNIHVGEYQVVNKMLPKDVLNLFSKGLVVKHEITFLEGWSFSQMVNELNKNQNINHTILDLNKTEIMDKIGHGDQYYEGLFFPDTYQFANRTKDTTILRIAYDKMQQELTKAWDSRDLNVFVKNPYELLILASIIEREAGNVQEMNEIAGVFQRRVEKNMPLQTDPTVIYGMGDKYKGRLLYKDLKKDTPYNTYTRKGLPPTPISMPGIAALNAAAHPDNSGSLYFVATGRGGHTFSKTYKEHLKAVKQYRKRQKK